MPAQLTAPNMPFHEVVSNSKFEPIELGGIDLEIDAIAAHRNILCNRYDESARKAGEATVDMLKALALKLEDGSLKTADPFTEGNIFVKVPTDTGVYHVNPFSAAKSQVSHALGVVAKAVEDSSLKVADPFTEGAVFKQHEDLSHLKETTMNILTSAALALQSGSLKVADPTTEGKVFDEPKKDLSSARDAVSNALVAAMKALQKGSRSVADPVFEGAALDDAKITVASANLKASSALDACADALKQGVINVNWSSPESQEGAEFTLQSKDD